MTTGLASHVVSQRLKRSYEITSRKVSRQPHTAMTSSRTKWRRTTLGSFPSSRWQRTASRTCSYKCARSSASVTMDSPTPRAMYHPPGPLQLEKSTHSSHPNGTITCHHNRHLPRLRPENAAGTKRCGVPRRPPAFGDSDGHHKAASLSRKGGRDGGDVLPHSNGGALPSLPILYSRHDQ